MTWVLAIVLVNGSYGQPTIIIPGFKTGEDCRLAATDAMKQRSMAGDTRVRDAICFRGPPTP